MSSFTDNNNDYCNQIIQSKTDPDDIKGIECIDPNNVGIRNYNDGKVNHINKGIFETLKSTYDNYYNIIPKQNYNLLKSKSKTIFNCDNNNPHVGKITQNVLDNINNINEDINFVLSGRNFDLCFDNELSKYRNDENLLTNFNIRSEKPTTLQHFIKTLNIESQVKITSYIIYYSFIRSYIDFYHDFEYHAPGFIEYLKTKISPKFYENIEKIGIVKKTFIDELNAIDSNVVTKFGSVNQTACKKILKDKMEDYCKKMNELGLYWLTSNKESAFMCSVNLNDSNSDKEKEIQTFKEMLKEDGIDSFYIETDKSHTAEQLLDPNLKLKMIFSISGKRDAGGGMSIESAYKKKKTENLDIIFIEREYTETVDKPEPRKYLKGKIGGADKRSLCEMNTQLNSNNPNMLVSDMMFYHLLDMHVNSNCKGDNIKTFFDGKEVLNIESEGENANSFSVNGLLATIGYSQLRGEGNSPAIPQIKFGSDVNIKDRNLAVVLLKTYTDYIQLLDVHDIKNNNRTVFTTLDMLCEHSAMLFGLPSILSENNNFTYYCYDMRYHSIDEDKIKRKYSVLLVVKKYYSYFKEFVEKYFDEFKNYLKTINENHYDPSVYYSSKVLLDSLDEIRGSALEKLSELVNENITIEKIKTTPPSIKEYINQICQFSVIKSSFDNTLSLFQNLVKEIIEIKSREGNTIMYEKFSKIKQEILNSLPVGIQKDEFNTNVSLFFSAALLSKLKRSRDNLELAYKDMLTQVTNDDDKRIIEDILSKIMFIQNNKTDFFSDETDYNEYKELVMIVYCNDNPECDNSDLDQGIILIPYYKLLNYNYEERMDISGGSSRNNTKRRNIKKRKRRTIRKR